MDSGDGSAAKTTARPDLKSPGTGWWRRHSRGSGLQRSSCRTGTPVGRADGSRRREERDGTSRRCEVSGEDGHVSTETRATLSRGGSRPAEGRLRSGGTWNDHRCQSGLGRGAQHRAPT
ncbi:splicing factor PWI domain-containing protein isoform X2 [Iris pallida]|uniref:Splicing factor PWI domain-containing protein isoform X2 n=1 Tax=Iris pallida TaxID=29817 RepID=A0AAX6FW42_IRIPA|nr:splicing factor PWI domain-containing protein isoform X2 [Iris pallida]